MKNTDFVFMISISRVNFAQDISEERIPYYEVLEYAKEFTAGTMAARMVDALGCGFYWFSAGLSENDLRR